MELDLSSGQKQQSCDNAQDRDSDYLAQAGLSICQNNAGDVTVLARTNYVYQDTQQIAGPAKLPNFLPISYMIVEINFGKTIRKVGSPYRDQFEGNYMDYDVERSSMNITRVCVFRLSSRVASRKPAHARGHRRHARRLCRLPGRHHLQECQPSGLSHRRLQARKHQHS